MTRRVPLLAVAGLLTNALVWGTSWWPFRQLQAAGLHSLWATVCIYAVACAVIIAAQRGALRQLATTPALWWLVVAAGTTNATFNWAVTLGDVVRVVLLFYLMPIWSALFARWLLHERLSWNAGLRIALALAGAALVLLPADGTLPLPRSLADWLGIAGGVSFALNNVLLRRHAAQPPGARALAMFAGGTLLSALLAVALGAAGQVPWPIGVSPLAWAGAMALAAWFLVGNLALQYGASRLAASVTSVVMLSEIVFATLSSVLLAAETLSTRTVLGGALIMASALLAAFEPQEAHA
ncbi:MAG: DMT family transporter [Betaproteobacteria bacterium]|nr:DMT family transporter [Betaproteobacteria bacterium]